MSSVRLFFDHFFLCHLPLIDEIQTHNMIDIKSPFFGLSIVRCKEFEDYDTGYEKNEGKNGKVLGI